MYLLGRKFRRPLGWSVGCGEEENILFLLGIEPVFLGSAVLIYFLSPLTYFGSSYE
jgi:hypothetical protein